MREAMTSLRRRLGAMAAAAALAGCAVGPDHRTPPPPDALPDRFARDTLPPANGAPAEDAASAAFWRAFRDDRLDALVARALDANQDLRLALARYERALALGREAGFDRLPTVTAGGSARHARLSETEAQGRPRSAGSVGAAIQAGWEIDLAGRVRRHVEASRADAEAAGADAQALRTAIVGEVAGTYAQLRGLQARLRVARENAQAQQETLRLVQARLAGGRGTAFDEARARMLLEGTSSRVPALAAQIAVAQHRLAVLTGLAPGALVDELDAPAPQFALPPRPDPGTPAALLRRRPDVRAAEARLHAATARVGVASADLFPRVTLGAVLGSVAGGGSGLWRSASESNSAVLGIDWSFLDVGRVRARIEASQADAAAALAGYQRAVLAALESAENALARYDRTREEDAFLARAALDSEAALRLARVRLDAGSIDLLEVLDAQRAQLAAQDAWADSRTRAAQAAVALHQALAGGWPDAPAQAKAPVGAQTR